MWGSLVVVGGGGVERIIVSADDPYYCGFSARVPNFVKAGGGGGKQKTPQTSTGDKSSSQQHQQHQQQPQQQHQLHQQQQHQPGGREAGRPGPKYREPGVLTGPPQSSQSGPGLAHIPQVQPFWWHSRLYPADVTAGGEEQQIKISNN